MNQKELKKAMNDHTPVYYIDDEYYDYNCEEYEYETTEAPVYEVYVSKQEFNGVETYLQFETDVAAYKYLIRNNSIFSNQKDAKRESARRFKYYVEKLHKRAKATGEALAECEKRLKELDNRRKTEIQHSL